MTHDTKTQPRLERPSIKYPNDLMLHRRERGLNRKQAAALIGRSVSTIRRYENGRMLPPLLVALKLEILYRIQLAGLYQPLYKELTREIRTKEEQMLSRLNRKGDA